MDPVHIFAIPHNGRMDIDSELLPRDFVELPIPMPKSVIAWTGVNGEPLAMWVDAGRIWPKDFAVVWAAIKQLNTDVERSGGVRPALPAPVFDDDDEDDDGGIPPEIMDSDRWT